VIDLTGSYHIVETPVDRFRYQSILRRCRIDRFHWRFTRYRSRLSSANADRRIATLERDILGEGTVRDTADGVLQWVDIVGKALRRYPSDTGAANFWILPQEPGSLTPTESAEMLPAVEVGFARFSPGTCATKTRGAIVALTGRWQRNSGSTRSGSMQWPRGHSRPRERAQHPDLEAYEARILESQAPKRSGTFEELAAAVSFLTGSESPFLEAKPSTSTAAGSCPREPVLGYATPTYRSQQRKKLSD
jgi:hypothetical protein